MNETRSEGAAVLGWWARQIGERNSALARGQAARLRRAGPSEVLAEPCVHDLARALGVHDPARLVPLVQVLAAVRGHVPQTLARRLGAGETPALSALRFQRLMRDEGADLATALRRALPMVAHECNVAVLGGDLLHWNDATRARWCFHYFGAAAPEPISEENTE